MAMNIITVSGVRGGVGATSVAAMLADALHALGQRVLAVDLNPSDLLRLHFNVPHADPHGWAAAPQPAQWPGQAFEVSQGLYLAPHGRRTRHGAAQAEAPSDPEFWLEALAAQNLHADWAIFDGPSTRPGAAALRQHSAFDLRVALPDSAAHVLLAQDGLGAASWLLVNGFDPTRQLACDILLDWRCRHGERVLPIVFHRDEAVHEALALKTPVTRYRPDASASHSARALALWCMAKRPEKP